MLLLLLFVEAFRDSSSYICMLDSHHYAFASSRRGSLSQLILLYICILGSHQQLAMLLLLLVVEAFRRLFSSFS